VQPAVFVSDVEVNIAIVTLACPDGSMQTVKAYREDARELREFIRTLKIYPLAQKWNFAIVKSHH
jgi:hypothetical protein